MAQSGRPERAATGSKSAPKPTENIPQLLETPISYVPMPAHFLQVLDEASRTAARQSTRFALSRLKWRGKRGEIVATDGRHLLMQGGFSFPWKDDVLVPRLSAFGCREFAGEGKVAVDQQSRSPDFPPSRLRPGLSIRRPERARGLLLISDLSDADIDFGTRPANHNGTHQSARFRDDSFLGVRVSHE
jgi:hypothetical protein